MKWEDVILAAEPGEESVERLRVPGGWIYKVARGFVGEGGMMSIAYVPDPKASEPIGHGEQPWKPSESPCPRIACGVQADGTCANGLLCPRYQTPDVACPYPKVNP
jgi:hypothetical protein